MMKALAVVLRSAFMCALFAGAAASPARAYTVKAGDLLLRPVAGASVNFLRFPAATRATPEGGMLVGVDFDYAIDGPLAVTVALRSVLAPSFVDGNLAGGLKYRLLQLNAPFIPYGSAAVVAALGGPLGHGDVHTNVGLRLAGGVDYFVMRDLAVGVEMAAEGTMLLTPVATPEASTEVLLGVTFRL